MNNPKLRFKEDDGSEFPEWSKDIVGHICLISTGKSNTQDKRDNGKYDFYVRSSKVEKSDKYLYDEEAVLTAGDGVGTGKVFHYVNGKYDLHQRVYRMYNFHQVIGKYFYYYFSQFFYRRIKAMSAKCSVDSVRLEMIYDMPIYLPSLSEQQKIAVFLSTIDDIITLTQSELTAWKERKKGVMQKIFKREVRFKADDGSEFPEWEEKRLEDLFKISAGGDIDKKNCSKSFSLKYPYPVYANALANRGLYGYANYFKVEGDTFTVTGRGDVGYAVARHGKYVPIVRLLVCEPKENDNVDFFAEQVNGVTIFVESTGVPQLAAPQLGKVKVKRPSFPEQKKIADCLSSLDDVINQIQAELSAWKEFKKGLLQQMFV